MLYISHNLGLILKVCDRVCVMYSGEVVERGNIKDLFDNPRHPYTRGLFDCIPLPTADKNARPLVPIRGQLPLPHARPPGCNFGPRCDYFVEGQCDVGTIPLEAIAPADTSHGVRCKRAQEIEWVDAAPPVEAEADDVAPEEMLSVIEMQKYYPVYDRSISAMMSGNSVRYVKANETISFTAGRQETVAIVGESGCGKSTFAKVLMGLETATDGQIKFEGREISRQRVQKRSAGQLSQMQMIFQNPNDTLNPSITVGGHIARVIRKFGVESNPARVRERVNELLDLVKLPREFANRRPRQLSGGQKQRVGIARAFAGNPTLVVADEPVSALDVSVQAAVTELLMDIQREHGTTLLFISHDLSVVRYLSDQVVVMYLGHIMERGTTDEVFSPPYHPYTEALLSAVPIADPNVEKKHIVLEGPLPSVMNPPTGCPFHTRCPRKIGDI
jgi:peptide/nickel transport system ATP-binding protein